jgi:hypothetical protein
MTMELCKHCRRPQRSLRTRGLCQPCYNVPSVREKFPIEGGLVAACARRGVGHSGAGLPEPTDARPGSEAKVRVLEERARLGQALWHPLDSRYQEQAPAAELVDRLASLRQSQRAERKKKGHGGGRPLGRPAPPGTLPRLRRKRNRRFGFVMLNRRCTYLGAWPDGLEAPPPAVTAKYEQVLAEWLAGGRRPLVRPAARPPAA